MALNATVYHVDLTRGTIDTKTLPEDVVDVPVAESIRNSLAAMAQGEPQDRDRNLESIVLLVPDSADERKIDVRDRQSLDRDDGP